MSVTENVMELKNESHPHFRENPQTLPNMESLASAYFSSKEKMFFNIVTKPPSFALALINSLTCTLLPFFIPLFLSLK